MGMFMSACYESLYPLNLYTEGFGVPEPTAEVGREVWPRRPAVFIRQVPGEAPADQPDKVVQRELVGGQFGLVPHWVKSASDAKLRATKLVNARSETVTTSHNFRDAWLAGQRCIVPICAFFEDDLRSGKPVLTRIARVDGRAMGVAGLWARWEKSGEVITSFTLLTINANSHALMHRYGHPGVEKRMLAILSEGTYDAWLGARPEKAREFMRAYPANWLLANPVEAKKTKLPPGLRGL